MMRSLALLASVLAPFAAQAQLFPLQGVPPSGVPQNTVVISSATGAAVVNYPLQLGRPFLPGRIAHAPAVLVNGALVPTQADVKNRWPDGSVKFAVIAVVLPTIPASGALTLSFADSTSLDNTPLTTAQMLDPAYDFDAVIAVTGTAAGAVAQTASARAMLANGDCRPWTSGPVAQTMMCGDDSAAARYDIGFDGAHHPLRPRFVATFWPATHQVAIRAVGENGKMTELTDLTYTLAVSAGSAAPQSVYGADLTNTIPGGIAGLSVAAAQPSNYIGPIAVSGTPAAPPVEGTLYNVQDTATGETMQARWTAAAGWVITAANGLSGRGIWTVPAPLTVGDPLVFGLAWPKAHWAMSTWTRTFWLGGTPEPRVNIDYNLPFLAAARFVPNFDTAIVIPESARAAYDAAWTGNPHDIYDGSWTGGSWQNRMNSTGGRMEIGPYPSWMLAWLYTGDWRLRRMALGMTDLAGAFPANLRESSTGKPLSRYDPAGSSTGLGRNLSVTGWPRINTTSGQLFNNSFIHPVPVGPINPSQPWRYDGAHQPATFYLPYLLTGDPWCLGEMYLWAGMTSGAGQAGSLTDPNARGPTGSEGGIAEETRGLGWVSRNRAEVAFIAPDADPEKAYFTYLMNDALARWEGVANITGTAYQTAPPAPGDTINMWAWGRNTGNLQSQHPPAPVKGTIGPLNQWDTLGNNESDACAACVNIPHSAFGPDVLAVMSPWMQSYFAYGVGRAKELGFAAGPLLSNLARFSIGRTLDSGLPQMVAVYHLPTLSRATGSWYQTWPDVAAALAPGFVAGTPDNTAYPGGLSGEFAAETDPESYVAPAKTVAAYVYGEPRGDQNWAWFAANAPVVTNKNQYSPDPRWAIVPRTDANVMPAIPVN